jgi:hypothetical protein
VTGTGIAWSKQAVRIIEWTIDEDAEELEVETGPGTREPAEEMEEIEGEDGEEEEAGDREDEKDDEEEEDEDEDDGIVEEIEDEEPVIYRYNNFYVDISSSFAGKKFRRYFKRLILHKRKQDKTSYKRLRSRILFGTDWYMTFMDGKDLWDYCKETKEFLDSFDTSLWPYFTQYNPLRFFRLKERIKDVAENMIETRNKNAEEGKEGALPELKDKDQIEIRKEAAWIAAAAIKN